VLAESGQQRVLVLLAQRDRLEGGGLRVVEPLSPAVKPLQ
jgi:hypothetical protein